jgi:hypothetical protein
MSINNIELPEFILAELYKDTLLYAPATATRPPAAAAAPVTTTDAAPAPPPIPTPARTVEPAQWTSAAAPAAPAPPPPPAATATPAAPTPASTVPATAGVLSQPSAATPPSGYKFLGNNRRKITILVASPGAAFLPDDQLTFLTKILEACQMNIGDVAIVNHAQVPVLITELKQQLQPSFILLFGVDTIAIRLPIQFPEFKIQAYDQCTYLSAPPLAQLVPSTHEGRLLKSKLWVSLKTMFDV